MLPYMSGAHALPPLSGSVAPAGSVGRLALSSDTGTVELRLLVISATDNTPEEVSAKTYSEPALAAWLAFLDQIGVPYEVLIATRDMLTVDRLVGPDGVGRFQGILLTTDALVAFDPVSGWSSAFSAEEWNLLWEYERDFRVRQVSLYTFPGTFPESHGIAFTSALAPGATPYDVRTTPEGQAVFPYLSAGVAVPLRYTYVYQASLAPDTTTPSPVPLLRDDAGNVLAVLAPSSDGRERIALTFAHNPYLLHSQLLGYGLIRWVTNGLFIGERRHYLGADVDDWFIAQDRWDIESSTVLPDAFHLSARDAFSARDQLSSLRSRYPVASGLAWTMAYNGEGAIPSAPSSCNPSLTGSRGLSRMTKCVAGAFFWVNHTWSHAYMDRNPPYYDISYEQIRNEIVQNDGIVGAFGFGVRFSARTLVTGDISGLGWFAPGGPDTGPKVDFGLGASNPDLLRASTDLGRSFIAGNLSTPSHEPACVGCGIVHPLEPRLTVVPRWPTNVFAVVTTPAEAVHAYNAVYGPSGSLPYFDRDLTYDEYLQFEADIALSHVLSGTPYPHYFHVANLREYASGRSLLADWTDRVLANYARFLVLPLRSLDWDTLGDRVVMRTSFMDAAAMGRWNRVEQTVTVQAAQGGTVFVTGMDIGGTGQREQYGNDLISWRTLAPGEVWTVDLRPPPVSHRLSVTKSGNGKGTVQSQPAGISCGSSCSALFVGGTTVQLTATPSGNSRFMGWSGACSGTGTCTVTMNGPTSVSAQFQR
jgi:hypothetical protein